MTQLKTALTVFVALASIILAFRTIRRPIMSAIRKGDVFFISHGGPPSMYATDSEAYSAWKKVGAYLKTSAPKGIVAVSAHWEKENSKGVLVNSNPSNPLIYDFYGFPKHYYQETFVSRGNAELLSDVQEALKMHGITVSSADRGLDHGVWVPLKVGFDGRTDIPLVQVSLPAEGTTEAAVDLGTALGALRDKGYAILASGQPVHNLQDAFRSANGASNTASYLRPFMTAAQEAVHSSDPKLAVIQLSRNTHYRKAHPTDEHFLPLPVAVGAADTHDKVEDIQLTYEMHIGWGFWRWSSAA